MATQVKAAVLSEAVRQYRREAKETQAFTSSISRELVNAGSQKGRLGEFLVKAELEELGFEVRILNGLARCDLQVKVGYHWKRVEVKTAVRYNGSGYAQFGFNSIKTKYFDMIAFVCVDYDRTEIRIAGGKYGKAFIDNHSAKCDNGRSFKLNRNYNHFRAKGQDIFTTMSKRNVLLSTKIC
tara:strand:- start:182 stop:727 length:546 start_codon:yes stop_codon:yes gene_type:complete